MNADPEPNQNIKPTDPLTGTPPPAPFVTVPEESTPDEIGTHPTDEVVGLTPASSVSIEETNKMSNPSTESAAIPVADDPLKHKEPTPTVDVPISEPTISGSTPKTVDDFVSEPKVDVAPSAPVPIETTVAPTISSISEPAPVVPSVEPASPPVNVPEPTSTKDASLESPSMTMESSVAPVTFGQEVPPPSATTTVSEVASSVPPPKKKSRKKLIVAAVVLLLFATLPILYFVAQQPQDVRQRASTYSECREECYASNKPSNVCDVLPACSTQTSPIPSPSGSGQGPGWYLKGSE